MLAVFGWSMDPYDRELGTVQDLRGFTLGYSLVQVLGLTAVLLVTIWASNFMGGFSGPSNPKLEFNYHPVFMVLGMVFLYGNGILVYRALRTERKSRLKLVHGALMALAFLCAVAALKTVFDSHNLNQPAAIPNLYSLHSWLGLTAVLLFCMQVYTEGGCCLSLYPAADWLCQFPVSRGAPVAACTVPATARLLRPGNFRIGRRHCPARDLREALLSPRLQLLQPARRGGAGESARPVPALLRRSGRLPGHQDVLPQDTAPRGGLPAPPASQPYGVSADPSLLTPRGGPSNVGIAAVQWSEVATEGCNASSVGGVVVAVAIVVVALFEVSRSQYPVVSAPLHSDVCRTGMCAPS
ncbi:uncharacterized protein LOC8050666 isoform X2 [Ixodes scapularis]|uniref:uncharacterized protein LOC8050666 isoform X2 n=1 Tax=Ixodes scapularis TaxID=6945 RepID=UPI001A9D9979|nr:uncharacterized protein LOC8050666 isoform X2 [Ixodes scapularis]